MGKKSGLFEKVRKHISDTIGLYDDIICAHQCRKDSSLIRKIPSEDYKIGVDFLGTYDKNRISAYYTLEKMPKSLPMNFKDRIRSECRHGVKVTFINCIRNHRIEWTSPQMQSRMRVLKHVGEENDNKDINAYNMYENIGALDKQAYVEESLRYLAIADRKEGRKLLKSSIMMIVSGYKGKNFDDTIEAVETRCRDLDIIIERLMYEIPDVIKYYSPFCSTFNLKTQKQVSAQVMTDEIMARFNTYNQGILGFRGLYWGTDIYSKFPVLKVVKVKPEDAENWLITAETGGGKSFFVKMMLLQLLMENYRGTIMDIEGFEYIPFANYVSHNSAVQVINMAEGQGKYFDPVEIPARTGIEDIDRDAKKLSINFTISILKVLLGRAYNEDLQVDIVINDAITELYKDMGVTDEMETWGKSAGLSLYDVYEKLKDLRKGDFRSEDSYIHAVETCIAMLSRFFEVDGSRNEVFKEKVATKDIIDADLVVCSFGMAGKSEHTIDQVQLALMQLSAAQISHQRSIYSKALGRYNFKLWEEFQRWGKFPDSDKTIGVALTGGRKLGDVNIVVTNRVKELLDDDRFGVFDSAQSFLIGAIRDKQVRDELCDRLSIPQMKPELDKLATAKREDESIKDSGNTYESIYRYAFLCGLDSSKYALVKAKIPRGLAKSKLFRTGVDLDGNTD